MSKPAELSYRTLHPGEQEKVINLWAHGLGDSRENRERIFCDFADDPHRFSRTHVAVLPTGDLCAAMSYWVREVRDADGNPQRVEHLWGAVTLAEFRRRGIATALIKNIIAAMQIEGCRWCMLFARDEARSLYEHMGWRGFSTTYRGGLVTFTERMPIGDYFVRSYDPFNELSGWESLAEVYAAYNHKRPLSLVRSEDYWRGYSAWMAGDWIIHQCATYLVLARHGDPQKILGYALVHFYDEAYAAANFGSPPWFHISELGLREPQSVEAAKALLAGVASEALSRNMGYGHFAFPMDGPIQASVELIFNQPLNEEQSQGSMMARLIAEDLSEAQLAALFSTPKGMFWEMDRF